MKQAEVNMLIQCMHAIHNGCVRDATNAHDQLLDMCEPEPAVPWAPPKPMSLPAAPVVESTTRVPYPGTPPSSVRWFTGDDTDTEYKKLLDYFNSPEGYAAHGRAGDTADMSPAETAIRGMKRSALLYKSLAGQNSRIDAYEKILREVLYNVDVGLGVKPRPVGSPFSGLDYRTLKANIEKVLE